MHLPLDPTCSSLQTSSKEEFVLLVFLSQEYVESLPILLLLPFVFLDKVDGPSLSLCNHVKLCI